MKSMHDNPKPGMCLFLMLVAIFLCLQKVAAQEAYAVLSTDRTTLTFYYDTKMELREGTKYDNLNFGYNDPDWYNDGGYQTITKVVFDDTFAEARPTCTNYWFVEMTGLTSISGMKNLNTSEVTSMAGMFAFCSVLTNLDLSSFDTQNVTSMTNMFYGCSSLTSLDLSNFNTKNVKYKNGMFKGCSSLTSIDIPNAFANIDNDMFEVCSNLASVTIPNSVGSIGNTAFRDCSKLTSVMVKIPDPLAIEGTTFANLANATLFVPTGCRAAYEAADYWKEFGEVLEVDGDPNVIMFADVNVRKICIDQYDSDDDGELSYTEAAAVNSLTGFGGKTSIIKFNELRYFTGLTELSERVFVGCSNLSSITLPNSITSIGDYAFGGCVSLTSIVIPSSVTSIGFTPFQSFTSIETIVVETSNTTYDSREGCNEIVETS